MEGGARTPMLLLACRGSETDREGLVALYNATGERHRRPELKKQQ